MIRSTSSVLILRILASILLLFSVLFMPWWVSIILGLAGIIYFSYFVEAIALFLLSDLLYGVAEAKFYGMVFVSFSVALVAVLFAEFIKKKIRFHN